MRVDVSGRDRDTSSDLSAGAHALGAAAVVCNGRLGLVAHAVAVVVAVYGDKLSEPARGR